MLGIAAGERGGLGEADVEPAPVRRRGRSAAPREAALHRYRAGQRARRVPQPAGVTSPRASPASASVASVPARVKRVGARNSRTSSQWRAPAASPRRASATAPSSPAWRSAVQARACADAKATSSPRTAARLSVADRVPVRSREAPARPLDQRERSLSVAEPSRAACASPRSRRASTAAAQPGGVCAACRRGGQPDRRGRRQAAASSDATASLLLDVDRELRGLLCDLAGDGTAALLRFRRRAGLPARGRSGGRTTPVRAGRR